MNSLNELSLIPMPQKVEIRSGYFKIDSDTRIVVEKKSEKEDSQLKRIADYLATELEREIFIRPSVVSDSLTFNDKPANSIYLSIDKNLKSEANRIKIKPDSIEINGGDAAGLFYGCVSLIQIARRRVLKKPIIKCVYMEDFPDFSWRGMMLDVARHFFSNDYILKFIDILAMYKLNRLHLHLTDDQGWRIQIDSYPPLTEIGAWRTERGNRYGGFYTKEDIKEIVDYAKDRFVDVIPEIDMPGHVQAALASYPELSCTAGNHAVKENYGISEEVFCVGKEKTYQFVEDVLKEVSELFPSKYIHVGGDECPTPQWESCPVCTKKLKEESFKSYTELQGYFERRVNDILLELGKTMIGWDEIDSFTGIDNAIVMLWRDEVSLDEILRKGKSTIIADNSYFYFNYPQSQTELKLARINFDFHIPNTPTKKTYSYSLDRLAENKRKLVLGIQGQLWTEYIETEVMLEYMVLPRLCALAEVAWLPRSKRNWLSFKKRLKQHGKRFKRRGIKYNSHISFWEAGS